MNDQTEREIWGKKEIPKIGPLRLIPKKGAIIEVYDGDRIKTQLKAMGFHFSGRVWEKEVEVKNYKKLLDELEKLGCIQQPEEKCMFIDNNFLKLFSNLLKSLVSHPDSAKVFKHEYR